MHLRITSNLLIVLIMLTQTLVAQNKEKAPGQTIWQETFDQAIWDSTVVDGVTDIAALPEGWTFSDITNNNFYWQWSNEGPRGRHTSPNGGTVPKNQLTPAAEINSTTNANGFLLLPSDWYNTNDDGTSTSPATPMNASVEYGPINISEFSQVHFKMEYFFKLLKPVNSEISIIFRDSTNSVTVPIDFIENIPSKNAAVADFNLTVLLEQNNINPEQLFFRISQIGTSHYFFMIDDIKFYQPLDKNIRVLDTWSDYHIPGGNSSEVDLHRDYFGGYKNIPLSVIDTFVQFRTQAQNFGGIVRENVYAHTTIRNLDIEQINPVYNNNSSTQTLQPSEIGVFTNTASFRPKLHGKYKISTSVTDGGLEDSTLNQKESEINITDGLFSYIDTSSTSSYLALQADTSSAGYGYGQAFWIPDILTNKVVFNNLAFFIHPNQNPNHLNAQAIEVQGYLFKKQGTNYEIVQTTNVYKPVAADIGKFVNLQFSTPQELDGNQSYYLVLKVTNQTLTRKLMLAHDPNHHQSYGNSGIKIGSSNNLIVTDKTPAFYTNITGGYIPEETDFLAYSIDGQLDNTIINAEDKTVELTMPYGTDVTSLIPEFVLSINAVAKIGEEEQISGTSVVDFTDTTVIYTITNGESPSSEWSVTINIGPEPPAEFLSFNIDGQIGQTTINSANKTVLVVMPNDTDVTALIPVFEITAGATAYINDSIQISGSTVNDFTNPVIYKLVTQGGVESDWTVTVTEQGDLLSGCDILSFGFIGQTQQADIDTEGKTVSVNLPPSTSVNSLVPIFILSPGAKAYHLQNGTESLVTSGGNIMDFTLEVTFRVKAENMTDFNDWKINVTTNQNSQADFESFEVHLVVQNEVVEDSVTVIELDTIPYYATIYKSNNTMLLSLPEGTRLDSIQPIWTVSPGAIVKINDTIVESGKSYIDLSKLVVFEVVSQHAQGAKQVKTWTLHTSYIVGIGEQDHDIYTHVKMYPNPASHYINVDLPEDMRNGSYQIFNIYGQTVASGLYSGIQFNIDIQGQPKGIYFIKVSSDRYHKIDKFLFE